MLRIRVHDAEDLGEDPMDSTVGGWGFVDSFEPYLRPDGRLGMRVPSVYVGVTERDAYLRHITWWWVEDGRPPRHVYTGNVVGDITVTSGCSITIVNLDIAVTFDLPFERL